MNVSCNHYIYRQFDDLKTFQLQGLRSEVSHVVPSERYVYFVGDSHCIPPAWQSIQIKVRYLKTLIM